MVLWSGKMNFGRGKVREFHFREWAPYIDLNLSFIYSIEHLIWVHHVNTEQLISPEAMATGI